MLLLTTNQTPANAGGDNSFNRNRMYRHGRISILVTTLLLGACARGQDFVVSHTEATPTPANFTICHGYGCLHKARVEISPAGWNKVKAVFAKAPQNASEERATIARAVALLEKKVGSATGTDVDEAGASLFAKNKFQQDCIDETVNTTTYLRLLDRENLLRFHNVGEAAWRGQFIDRWPHNTAVVVEKESGAAYTMDSWFYANGVEPTVVPLAKWKSGWSPPKASA